MEWQALTPDGGGTRSAGAPVVPAPKGEDSVPDTGKSSFSHLWEEDVPASPTQAIGRVHSQWTPPLGRIRD